MSVCILIFALALAGFLDALYFTLAYYGRVEKARWVPEILCAREGSACVTVVQTPYARIFGLPNSLLGMIYYLLLMSWVLFGNRSLITWGGVPVPKVSLIALLGVISTGTVVMGFGLIIALRYKLHVDCPLCYAAHAINAALLVLLVLAAR
jgi:uncharacterized membrane protein